MVDVSLGRLLRRGVANAHPLFESSQPLLPIVDLDRAR
jgi:hypothetical protein